MVDVLPAGTSPFDHAFSDLYVSALGEVVAAADRCRQQIGG
jgi:hypothetical protein